jgi:hypothetical protein
LLIDDAGQRWQGSPEQRTGFERGFDHGSMKNVSHQFQKATWDDWHDARQSVPQPLRNVAEAFVLLQGKRSVADYDNHKAWNAAEVEEAVILATQAFSDWESIRTDPMAGNYLLAMLVKRR